MKLSRLNILAMLLAATLSACGGGGDAAPETAVTQSAAADPALTEAAIEEAFARSSLPNTSSTATGEQALEDGKLAVLGVTDLGTPGAAEHFETRATPTQGCGRAGIKSGRYTVSSAGLTRQFLVSVPSDYNRSKPYRLIVALHGRGATGEDVFVGRNIRPFFGLQEQYKKDAIYVAPDGIDRGWPNVNGRDVRFMRDMVAKLKQELCIDSGHVYATGHSYGGMMSYAIGCEMGDVFRAVAPMSGGLRTPQTNQDVPSCAPSKNKVAAIMFHGRDDGIVPISWGYQAREMYLQKNSCKRTTVPVGKNGCVMYTGCSDAVVWCEYNGAYKGDHNPTGFSAQETRIFFDAIN